MQVRKKCQAKDLEIAAVLLLRKSFGAAIQLLTPAEDKISGLTLQKFQLFRRTPQN